MMFVVRLLCATALVLLTSCSSTDKTTPEVRPLRRLNVVVVTLDTLRADRLGCYGQTRIETPNLDKLAAGGALFENAVAQAPLTPPSHASMFTGAYPVVHKVRNTGGFVLDQKFTTLAEVLQQQGWDTAAFIGAAVLKKSFGLDQGFALYDDRMPKPAEGDALTEYPERRASAVVDQAVAWLGSRPGDKPYFLWVHVFDPHTPYDPPSPFREKYSGRPYDGEVAYTDAQLGRLFDAIDKRNTLVAALSDHGESLSEHGEYEHGVFLYDATMRIAFMMSGPGIPGGLRVKQQARTIDLLPTVLALLGMKPPPESQGTNLEPAFTGREVRTTYSYAETLFSKINMGWTELRAIRTNRWKYIRAPKPELYDLEKDPAELSNVISNFPKEASELEARLKAISGGDRGPEKVESQMVSRKTMDQLRSLGYVGGVSQGEYELTGQGVDPKDRREVLKLLYLAMAPDTGRPSPQALGLLRRAAAQDPANPILVFYLGDVYRTAGRNAEAKELYEGALRKGVKIAWLYSRLARIYLEEGNRDQAIASFQTAVQMNPSDSESLSDLGMVYLETGRLADAERTFQWAVKSEPDFALAHNGLGLAAIQKKDPAAARGHFEKAVQVDPSLLEAQLNLGRIYTMMGANTKARACFEAFLARASQGEWGHVIPKVRAELAAMKQTH